MTLSIGRHDAITREPAGRAAVCVARVMREIESTEATAHNEVDALSPPHRSE